MKAELIPAPTPAEYRGFPSLNRESKPYPRIITILNSKSNREGRSTHTTILYHKSTEVNYKFLYNFQQLKKVAVFDAGGKHLVASWDSVLPKKFWASRITQNTVQLYSTIPKKSRMIPNKFDQHPNLPENQECAHPSNQCSSIEDSSKNSSNKKQQFNYWNDNHAYSAILSRRFIGKAHLPSLRILA